MSRSPLATDHTEIYDELVARRYFAKFDTILGHLPRIAQEIQTDAGFTRFEIVAIGRYLDALSATFRALSLKYLMTGRETAAGKLMFDRHESGFPVASELLYMANDAAQAAQHLAGMPAVTEMKDRMIRAIVGEQSLPTRLQFSLSQRLYYEALMRGGLFLARNDVVPQWLGESGPRRTWLLSWAVYDTMTNLPVIYLMEVDDSGRRPLGQDERRWPQAQAHLMSQSLNGLKLVTIAQGFDTDFADLHPRRLRRLHIGPMYSASFTLQSGPIGEVLADANAPEGQDWALVWTLEELETKGATQERSGWFSQVERQIFLLDPFGGSAAETGASRTDRFIILPERPFQVLLDRNPPGFRDVWKFVVGAGGKVVRSR